MRVNRQSKLLIVTSLLITTTLACVTVLGPPETPVDSALIALQATQTEITYRIATLTAADPSTPTASPTITLTVTPTSQLTPEYQPPFDFESEEMPARLSPESLSNIDFGPPGEGYRDTTRPYLSGNPQTLDTAHFRIHYTTSGDDAVSQIDANSNQHPDFVEEVARAMEYAWWGEVEYFGWTAPPGDDHMGGDDRYDVYITNIVKDGLIGYTEGGHSKTIVEDNPNSEVVESNAAFSFLVLDNDFSDYEDYYPAEMSLLDVMYTTAAHEFNHAIQYGYDSQEPTNWLWEAAATWIEDELYDEINEGNDLIYAVAKAPDTCQLAEGGIDRVEDQLHWYGEWVFLRYISEHYGHNIVRALWEHAIKYDGYEIFDETLKAVDTDLGTVFKDFSVALLLRAFEEGADYPTVRLEGETATGRTFQPVDGVGQMGADYVRIQGSGVVTITLSSQNLQGVLVGIKQKQADIFSMPDGQVSVDAGVFDKLYLVVLNLERAETEADCTFSDYKLTITNGGQAQQPDESLSAPHFVPPRVETLLDPADYYDE